MGQRPGQLGVHGQRQHAAGRDQLMLLEAVEAHQPVGLVQPVLAHQRRGLRGQARAGMRDGAEGRVVHALQLVAAVQRHAGLEDAAVVAGIGAHHHLRALAGRGEARRPRHAGRGAGHRAWLQGAAAQRGLLVKPGADARHRTRDAGGIFFGRQRAQRVGRGQLDVDAQPVSVAAGAGQQFLAGIGNGLEVDVAAEMVVFTQAARHLHQLLHGVVGRAHDARAEEQALDQVAAVEIERQGHHFVGREAGARDVAADAVDAVQAVVLAPVGEQDLQQRDAAAIGRVAVADAHAAGGAQAALVA